ncbi:MAG: Fe-S cluster assembly protein SufD [Chloroflexota bacterium]|nr:MAG: Fe-S cluster assembly protein SufD [Chloroflexota bacterium]
MARTVVTTTRKKSGKRAKEFNFTKEMIPINDGSSDFVRNYRENAWKAYQELAMPTTNDEPWRRTDLRKLKASSFRLPVNGDRSGYQEVPEELLEPLVSDKHAGQIIITPEGAETSTDHSLTNLGVIFSDLKTAEKEHPEILQKILGKVVKSDEGKFAALSSAFAEDGILVYVPRNVRVEQPLHSVLWGPGIDVAYFSHILIWLEEGASLTYVHEAASTNEPQGQTLHAGLIEINVESGADLRFVELQSWGEHVWNFTHKRALVGKDANIDWVFAAVGSHLTKDFSDLDLVGEGAVGRMSGFYFTDKNQHLDHDTQQNHFAPNTTSDLLFKGALMEESRSVWQGMIYVAPGAQKTDGYQANRNLVLSRQARADSIPGLEIMADDVRCTHGATVGKIDPDELFYLRSRGIALPEAERLVVEGFFEPIMQRIPFDGVKNRLNQAINRKMAQN